MPLNRITSITIIAIEKNQVIMCVIVLVQNTHLNFTGQQQMMKQCDLNETNFELRFSIRQMNIIVIYMIIDIYMGFLIHVKLIYNNPYFNPFFFSCNKN